MATPALLHRGRENGGFGRASQLLHVAQSLISEQIRDLEAELGAPLFDRNNRNIRLTAEGEQFLVDARAVYSPVVLDKMITLCAEAGFSPKIGATAGVSSERLRWLRQGKG